MLQIENTSKTPSLVPVCNQENLTLPSLFFRSSAGIRLGINITSAHSRRQSVQKRFPALWDRFMFSCLSYLNFSWLPVVDICRGSRAIRCDGSLGEFSYFFPQGQGPGATAIRNRGCWIMALQGPWRAPLSMARIPTAPFGCSFWRAQVDNFSMVQNGWFLP